MERQCVKVDSRYSDIIGAANRYAIETQGDPRYPLDLFLRVITVSLKTMKIVRNLPELKINCQGRWIWRRAPSRRECLGKT